MLRANRRQSGDYRNANADERKTTFALNSNA